ncbi:MAG: TadE/TadG family type IV pilus assembly protein [Solirubrobacterales bacterium]
MTTSSIRSESGQSAAELVAVVPILIVVTLALAQLAIAGYALWTAGSAARAAARAEEVGGDPHAAAHSAVPNWLERRMEVETGDRVEVRLAAPAVLPGTPAIPVSAATTLGPES